MPLWTLDNPPAPRNANGKLCVATEAGWTDPDTGEVLIAISNLTDKAGEADVIAVAFDAEAYLQGDPIALAVRFNEAVDVTAGATIEVSFSGLSGNITLHAVEQLDTALVVFDKQSDLVTDEVVPAEAGDLSVAAQSIIGTVVDAGTAVAANLAVSAEVAAAAGEISVA
jgi:hypothetical protein